MSHGRHSGRAGRTSSTVSSSSSSSAASHVNAATLDFSSIQRVIRHVFRSSRITVLQAERLQGRLHQVYLTRLDDGSSLVLKCPPTYNTRLLRHERNCLKTERMTLETLREFTQLSVPQVIKYDSHGGTLGAPFLLMSHVSGRKLSEISSYLSANERNAIDRTLGVCVRTLTNLSATQFGSTHKVFDKEGKTTWREAFNALLEAAIRDAEDMQLNIYAQSVRSWIGQHVHFLDEVTEPRLVALDVCDPENVLIDEQSRQVAGLVGFSNVIWGDPLMSGGITNGSDAFFEGLGERPTQSGGIKARQLMYLAYRAIVRVATANYRPHLGIDEDAARRTLSSALHELAQM